MSSSRGIFTLNNVNIRTAANLWDTASDVWVNYGKTRQFNLLSGQASTTTGYFGGGGGPVSGNVYAGPGTNTLHAIDFTNDTVSAASKTPLIYTKYALGSSSNSDYGWFGGGRSQSSVERIDYSNDTSTPSARGSLTAIAAFVSGTGNANYGWFGSRSQSPGFNYSYIDRIDYSNDTATASSRADSIHGVSGNRGSSDGQDYGWFVGGGGFNTPRRTFVERLDFANDTSAPSPRGNINVSRGKDFAISGNASYAWFGGGYGSLSSVERIDYSSDTAAASPKGPLVRGADRQTAVGNSSYGWFDSGRSSNSGISRIDYSNDTATATPRGTVQKWGWAAGVSSAGFGFPQASPSVSPNVPEVSYRITDVGYFGGAAPIYGGTSVWRYSFAQDTIPVSTRTYLSQNKVVPAATGNDSYAWFGGGSRPAAPPLTYSSVDRIDYSNDTAATSPRGSLAFENMTRATGNRNYGWFFVSTNVARIDYGNDTATATTRGNLSIPRADACIGNLNFAYLSVGSPTTIDRIEYSNDTATATPRGNMFYPWNDGLGSVGNANYGWIGGGYQYPFGSRSHVQRIDYSNDTATASPRGGMSDSKRRVAGTGNANYGWFGGGYGPGNSRIDRIDYSNDTVAALLRIPGPLSGLSSQGMDACSASENGLT